MGYPPHLVFLYVLGTEKMEALMKYRLEAQNKCTFDYFLQDLLGWITGDSPQWGGRPMVYVDTGV